MGAFSFLSKAAVIRLGDAGDALTGWYAEHNPETASKVDIADLKTHSDNLAVRIAEIEIDLKKQQAAVTNDLSALDRDTRAAKSIGGRLQAAAAAAAATPNDGALADQVTSLTTDLNEVMSDIERLGGPDGSGTASGLLFNDKQTLASAQADLQQFHQAHTQSITDWTTANTRLNQAHYNMEHAEQTRKDAERRQAQAERDAGLLTRPQTGQIALAAMEQNAEKSQKAARAAEIQANALRHVSQSGGGVASIVDAALAGDKPAPESALDRLARLTSH